MLTKFCPKCFAMNSETATTCERCGADLDEPFGSDYVDRLIHALNHPEPNTRALVALLLGKIGDERALNALSEKAHTSNDMALLEAIAEALGNFQSPQAIEALKGLTQSQWLTVRVKAKAALRRIKSMQTPPKASPDAVKSKACFNANGIWAVKGDVVEH